MITSLTFLSLLLLALTAHRITRLIVADTILDPLRERLHQAYPFDGGFVRKPEQFSRRWFNYLVTFRWAKGKPAQLKRRYRAMPAGNGGEAERWFVQQGHWIGNLTSCAWCTGFWVSLLVVGSYALFPIGTLMVGMPFALSTLVGLIAGHESA